MPRRWFSARVNGTMLVHSSTTAPMSGCRVTSSSPPSMLGSADVTILQKVAPKATRVELNDVASVALAVPSGRPDAMVTAVFGALVAKNRNPDLGDFVLLHG